MLLAITHRAILTLRPEHAIRQLLHNPALHKGLLVVAHPNVSLARKVVLALHDANIREYFEGSRGRGGNVPCESEELEFR